MTVFTLDGKTHAVTPEDTVLIKGPITTVILPDGTDAGMRLRKDDTLELLCSGLRPGELSTVADGRTIPEQITRFFRPMENSHDTEASVDLSSYTVNSNGLVRSRDKEQTWSIRNCFQSLRRTVSSLHQ